MRPIATVSVLRPLPPAFARLHELAHNLLWTWEPRIRECLRAIDPERWHGSNHNPTELFSSIDSERLNQLADDPEFVALYNRALEALDSYRSSAGWYRAQRPEQIEPEHYAYFSAEFGLHESVPLYSGGLGVLAGDHIKASSDLDLPLIAVCLFYQMGYFHQRLTVDGGQLESYQINDPTALLLDAVTDSAGTPLTVTLDMPRGPVVARLWRRTVGRVPLLLLDTNIAENPVPEYRDIADYLYGGDQETRIMQEIVLGIGGMRALRSMGIEPTVVHCNEGHSAFLLLERIRMTMSEEKMTFEEAAELVAAGAVFTTHTPVPAGNDAFPPALVETYFRDYWPQLGLTREQFLGLGRVNPANQEELFSMTVLALRLTSGRNGVSALHGEVSRSMWKGLWRNLPTSDVPITGVTNGVHTATWVADSMRNLFEKYGGDWQKHLVNGSADGAFAEAVERIPDTELWETKCGLREALINDVHRRLEDRNDDWYLRSRQGRALNTILDPNALTIGFARRFATYKRATLLFRDPERALRLFTDPERPLQLLLAGKAHPRDAEGKKFVQKVIAFIREHNLEGRIIFVEDYDMAVARKLVQGCDVWLNTPRRPMEASGTSGMKAAINGALNLSVLDGWFPEAWDGTNGFAIGGGEEFNNEEHQDEHDSRALYRVLEEEVLPAFFDRDKAGVPHHWIGMMKRSIGTITPQYSSNRMAAEYATRFYFPASDRFRRLRADGGVRTRALIAWRRHVRERWESVRVISATADASATMEVGQVANLRAQVDLGGLSPNDVQVQAYYGALDSDGMIAGGGATRLDPTGMSGTIVSYAGTATLDKPGRIGITVRVLPSNPDLADPLATGLVRWASPA